MAVDISGIEAESDRCVVCGGPRTDPPAKDCRTCRFMAVLREAPPPALRDLRGYVPEAWAMSWVVYAPYPAPLQTCLPCDAMLDGVEGVE